MTYQRKTI